MSTNQVGNAKQRIEMIRKQNQLKEHWKGFILENR